MNKKRARAIIEFDYHISRSGIRGSKSSYRKKCADELNKCFRENGVGFKPSQAVVCLKDKFAEGIGATYLPCDKQNKNNYSALKNSFKESPEDI